MTKLEAIARQAARISDKPEQFKPWERDERIAIARIDMRRSLLLRRRRLILKSGHM